MSAHRRRIVGVLAGLAILCSAGSARAADQDPASSGKGLMGGASLGWAGTDPILCFNCSADAIDVSGRLGMSLSRKVALLVELRVIGKAEIEEEGGLFIIAGGAQFRPIRRTWTRVGVGMGRADRGHSSGSGSRLGLLAGVGFDAISKDSFAMDVHLQGSALRGPVPEIWKCAGCRIRLPEHPGWLKSVTLGVGVNWYRGR